jgi:acyl-CoA synthetase (AMP-forming)/AMP-acid ligase II
MFAELLKGEVVENDKRPTNSPQCTVALLCPSSPLFLFAWLGLIKLGCSVLLIAYVCLSHDRCV